MTEPLGYVVIERNLASEFGPILCDGCLHEQHSVAEMERGEYEKDNKRFKRYTVAEVREIESDD